MEHALCINRYYNVALVLAGSIFLALMSQLAIHLPYTSVPFTMQTLGVFLLGGVLGSRLSVLAVAAYLVQGTLGLPVFAGGVSNPFWFCSPQAGFLVSFLLAAWIAGRLLERRPKAAMVYVFLSLACAQLAIFLFGAAWLALFVGPSSACLYGIAPFLFGAGCKIAAATCILKGVL